MATETVNPTPDIPDGEGKVMSFFDHIDELRSRLLRAIIAIAIGIALSLFVTTDVIKYMMQSYGQKLVLLNPTDSVVVYFKVSLMLGAIIGMPIIVYQLFMFVLPGLTRQEKRWVFLAMPGVFGLFLFGLLATWFFIIPLYIQFLASFQGEIFITNWTADSYITFVTTVLFWHAVAIETPVIFYVLGRMGAVTPRGMIKYWRHAIVAAAILGAVITPTVDPFTMLFITGLLIGLYTVSIFLVFFAVRVNRRRLAALQKL